MSIIIISTLVDAIDSLTAQFAFYAFLMIGGPIKILLNTIALLGLIFIALNQIFQFQQISYSNYVGWAIRFALVYAFSTMWINFSGFYTILMELPDHYAKLLMNGIATGVSAGSSIISALKGSDTYSALDTFAGKIIDIAFAFIGKSFFMPPFGFGLGEKVRGWILGGVTFVVGSVFIAVAALIIMMSRIGLAIMLSLAPLAIIMLMLEQTRHYFESWLRLTVGFAIVPLITTILTAFSLYVAARVEQQTGATLVNPESYLSFVFVMIAVTVLLKEVPEMASSLASTSVVMGKNTGRELRQIAMQRLRAPSRGSGSAASLSSGSSSSSQNGGWGQGGTGSGGFGERSSISDMLQGAQQRSERSAPQEGESRARQSDSPPPPPYYPPSHSRDQELQFGAEGRARQPDPDPPPAYSPQSYSYYEDSRNAEDNERERT